MLAMGLIMLINKDVYIVHSHKKGTDKNKCVNVKSIFIGGDTRA